jgi:hypothetical protein
MSEIAEHWIGGEWVGSGSVSESVNPATGAVLGRWADGGKIATAEHFIDPAQVHPNYGDSFSREFDQEGSSYACFKA